MIRRTKFVDFESCSTNARDGGRFWFNLRRLVPPAAGGPLRLHRDCYRNLFGSGGPDRFRIWEQTPCIVFYDNQMGASVAADPTTRVGVEGAHRDQK